MTDTSINNFKKLYEQAKDKHVLSFVYNGEEFSLGYASYLLNFIFPQQQLKDEKINSQRQESTC